MPGWQLVHAIVQRLRVTKLVDPRGRAGDDRGVAELTPNDATRMERPDLRPEEEAVCGVRVIERLDAEGVADEPKPPLRRVERREGKHAAKLAEEPGPSRRQSLSSTSVSPLRVNVSRVLHLRPQLDEVVDLPVKRQRQVRRRPPTDHRLPCAPGVRSWIASRLCPSTHAACRAGGSGNSAGS